MKADRETFCTSIIENGKQRNVVVTDEEETVIRNWVNARDAEQILSDLAANFAPIIHGHNTIKKAIIIQAVGGLRIEAQDKRGDIHILLLATPVQQSPNCKRSCASYTGSVLYDCSQASQAGLVAAARRRRICLAVANHGQSNPVRSHLHQNTVCALDEFHLLGSKDSSVIEALNVALKLKKYESPRPLKVR